MQKTQKISNPITRRDASTVLALLLLFSSESVLADISGKVFRDFNANGSFDASTSFNEVGMAGVTVKAFDATGAQVGTAATTSADGSYTLTGLTASTDYRVEFSWAQSWLKPGASGGTSVQFAKGDATGINTTVSNPVQYCQTNPKVGTTRIVPDHQTAKPTILGFDYDSSGDNRSAMTVFADGADKVGTTWGVAYQRDTKKLYASAVLRRHASEGNLGFGGIYEIDTTNPSAAPVEWLTLANVGTLAARSIPADGNPSHDIEAYQKIGKLSLGDIDISDDGKTLYAMNLNTRSLVPIDIATKTPGTPIAVGDPGCSSPDDARPWAVKVQEGEVYVGVVCSDESTGSITSKFQAHVMKLTGSSFTKIASMPLNYEKDRAAPGAYPTPKEACDGQRGWFPWTSNPSAFTSFAGCRGSGDADKNTVIHPQPILSDIEFDTDGSIILGMLDRFTMQVGSGNYAPDAANTQLYAGMGGGDIRRICNVNGSYVAEGNAGCAFNGGQDFSKNNEFYTGDRIMYSYNGDPANLESAHSETSLGAVALRAGSGEVLMSTYDPLDDPNGTNSRWATQGVSWLSNTNGNKLDSFEIVSNPDQDFGKVSGMGDVELMCDEAPVEIGNRVWLDTDNDGIQDAGENGIPNVQVKLFAGATELATVTTAADGTYYFTNATGTNTDSKKYGLTQLQPNATYTVKFPTTASVSGTTYNLTTAIAGSNTLIDSNAPATGEVTISATDIPSAGANNHSFDVGYSAAPVATETDLVLTKTANPTTAKSGDTVTYTLTLRNESDADATGVQVTDNLPTSLELVNATPQQGTFVNGVWDVGTVKARTTLTLTLETRVK